MNKRVKLAMTSKVKLTALHGFFGCAADWEHLSSEALGVSVIHAPEIRITDSYTLSQWAETFNLETAAQDQKVMQDFDSKSLETEVSQKAGPPIASDNGSESSTDESRFNPPITKQYKNILMGYSQGGRLALHALLSARHSWDAAIIISAHPGLASSEEKEARLARDLAWADRFEQEPWDALIESWESQQVFAKTNHRFNRRESDYDRAQLAGMLRHWSLGFQDNLMPMLQKLMLPILWIAGANDQTYREMATSIQLTHPLSRVWIAPDSGHRVPWEQPNSFQDNVKALISTFHNF